MTGGPFDGDVVLRVTTRFIEIPTLPIGTAARYERDPNDPGVYRYVEPHG